MIMKNYFDKITNKDLKTLKQLRKYVEVKNNNCGDLDVALDIINDWINELEEE